MLRSFLHDAAEHQTLYQTSLGVNSLTPQLPISTIDAAIYRRCAFTASCELWRRRRHRWSSLLSSLEAPQHTTSSGRRMIIRARHSPMGGCVVDRLGALTTRARRGVPERERRWQMMTEATAPPPPLDQPGTVLVAHDVSVNAHGVHFYEVRLPPTTRTGRLRLFELATTRTIVFNHPLQTDIDVRPATPRAHVRSEEHHV